MIFESFIIGDSQYQMYDELINLFFIHNHYK
jgi:hypothetical protein